MKLLIYSQISTVALLKMGMDLKYHPTFHNEFNYLSILGFYLPIDSWEWLQQYYYQTSDLYHSNEVLFQSLVFWSCGRREETIVDDNGIKIRGRFKNTYELLNPGALKISVLYKIISFNVWVRYFVRNFKGYLWNSTQVSYPYIER